MLKTLSTILNQADLEINDSQLNAWLDYVKLLDKWNKAYNLTSVRDPKEMLSKHILDSLLIAPHLVGKRFIDVGTGPGLPGIPLAIYHSDKQFVLLDSLGKRIRFLKQTIHELGLKNVEIVQSRVEDYQPEEKFDGVISRAFASLQDMATWCAHLATESGYFYAMKGVFPQDEIDQLDKNQFIVEKTFNLAESLMIGERHLIMLKLSR